VTAPRVRPRRCCGADPTGTVYDRVLLGDIAELAIDARIWVVFDECYGSFVYDPLYSTVKRMLAEHAFRPGEPVIASELAVRLGVSHIPVREVLTRLAVEGRLEHKLHKGFWMRPHSVKELRDKYKLTYLLLAHSIEFDVGAFTMDGLEKPIDFEYDAQGVMSNTNHDLINTLCRFIEQLFERIVSVGDNMEFDRIIRQFNDFTRPFRLMDRNCSRPRAGLLRVGANGMVDGGLAA